jgi:hypothetical protein
MTSHQLLNPSFEDDDFQLHDVEESDSGLRLEVEESEYNLMLHRRSTPITWSALNVFFFCMTVQ